MPHLGQAPVLSEPTPSHIGQIHAAWEGGRAFAVTGTLSQASPFLEDEQQHELGACGCMAVSKTAYAGELPGATGKSAKLLSLQIEHEKELTIPPLRAANEERAAGVQHGIRFHQHLLLTPNLKVEIHAAIWRRAFRVDLQKQIAGRNDPRFILAKHILDVLADDLKVRVWREDLPETAEEVFLVLRCLFGAASELGGIRRGIDEGTPDFAIRGGFFGGNRSGLLRRAE
jgi:hypothetical protein